MIDFRGKDVFEAQKFTKVYNHIFQNVYPEKKDKADKEIERNEQALEVNPLFNKKYLQPIITQYFMCNKSEIWSLSLIVHSKG